MHEYSEFAEDSKKDLLAVLWHNRLSPSSWFGALLCFVPSVMTYSASLVRVEGRKYWIPCPCPNPSLPLQRTQLMSFNFWRQKIPPINLVSINKKHFAAAAVYDHSTQKIVNWPPLSSFLTRKGCSLALWLLAWILVSWCLWEWWLPMPKPPRALQWLMLATPAGTGAGPDWAPEPDPAGGAEFCCMMMCSLCLQTSSVSAREREGEPDNSVEAETEKIW